MVKFNQGQNNYVWFSEDGLWAIVKRFSFGDFLLFIFNDKGFFNWSEIEFDGWDDIIKYLENKNNETI